MRIKFGLLIFISLIAGNIYSQQLLSSNYETAIFINVHEYCENVEYLFDNTQGNDLEIPRCYRMYPGASSYFKFVVPETGWATVRMNFTEETLFGLAFYKFEDGEYHEIKCDVFRSTQGFLTLNPSYELQGQEILARFWKLGDPDQGSVGLCIFSQEMEGFHKVLSVSTTQYTVNQLVQDVLITGCLTADNIQYTGHSSAIGYFYNGIPGLDFADGVIMASGNVATAVGPNNTGSSGTNLGQSGSPILNSIANGTTYDAAILSFNFVPASNVLEFQYVFASEEYPEFANSYYNDVFAFLLSGGPENYNNVNIALIPGTSTPVTINNVNHIVNSQYYIDNQGSANIQYDGMTVTLTATKPVTPCATYNIKLAIADVYDGIYDSAVFLKAASFVSGENYTVQSFNSWSPAVSVMRGCSNYIVFSRTDATPLNQPVPVEISISGTAVPGVDYSPIPTNLVIPAGQQNIIVYFDAYDLGYPTGDRTIILTFENGCPCSAGTTEHVITITDAFSINPVLINDSPVCVGDPATLTLQLNTPNPQHVQTIWSTGDTDVNSIQVTPNQTTTYWVQVLFPCDTITLYTTVQVVQPPVVNLGPDFSVPQLNTNLVAYPAPGNTGEWSFVSGPGTANILNPTSANASVFVSNLGTYTFQWTETSLPPNCVSSDQISVYFYHIPVSEFTASTPLCFGDNINIVFTGDIVPSLAIFNWDFDNANIISGEGQGPYVINFPTPGYHTISCTVTEELLSDTYTLEIFVPTPVGADLVIEDDPCFESCRGRATVLPTGGTPPYSYTWGSSTNVMMNLCVGDYSVIVMDHNACTYQTSFTINQPPPLTFTSSSSNVLCYNTLTGSAHVDADGGTPPYHYLWSDGFNMADHTGIAAGQYLVTISDANGCSLFHMFNITQPNLLQVSTSGNYAICENQSVNIIAQEMGGTAPYVYYWDNGDGTGFNPGPQTFITVPHNDITYTVYVVDANGCVSNQAVSEIIVSPEMSVNLTVNNAKCYQSCDGSAHLQINGGLQPFSYSWAASGPNLNNLCAGLYTVTVTDRIGCKADTMFIVTQPTALNLNLQNENAKCHDSNDGSITALVTGGTPPYNYLWSNNAQSNQITVAPGNYFLTVADANNCRVYGNSTISAPQQLRILPLYNPTICLGGTATVIAQAAGGSQPYQFYWLGDNGEEQFVHMFNTSPQTTTNYNLTVTDNNGCTALSSGVTVNVLPPITIANVNNRVNHVCEGKGVYIELDISGGNGGPYTIVNHLGEIIANPFIFYPTETTNLILTVDDDCETPAAVDSIMIYVEPLPYVDFIVDPIEGCPGTPLSFQALDTVSHYSYRWDFGDNKFAFVKNPYHAYFQGGTYNVGLEVTDMYGCKNSLTKSSFVNIFPRPYANFIANPEVVGILNPMIKFKALSDENDKINYYFWYYGDGDSTINFKEPVHYFRNIGEYEVTLVVENEQGCRDTAMRKILVNDQHTVYAPTAFTPNGDGMNDCFRICGEGINRHSFEMKIYNRWGELVFYTDVFNPNGGCDTCGDGAWDGTRGSRMKGDPYLPNGVYYWYVTFTDYYNIGHTYSGHVQLIR